MKNRGTKIRRTKIRGTKIKDRKRRGEWAEMCFMTVAAAHGLQVNKPWGEMSHFDFVIGDHGCLLRVQVKSTLAPMGTGYVCSVRGGHRPYTGDVFDFLAVLVVPEDVWFIIPAKLVLGKNDVSLYPGSPNSKYAPYKEAWQLLRPRACMARRTKASPAKMCKSRWLPEILHPPNPIVKGSLQTGNVTQSCDLHPTQTQKNHRPSGRQ